jgi:hypothetical protein
LGFEEEEEAPHGTVCQQQCARSVGRFVSLLQQENERWSLFVEPRLPTGILFFLLLLAAAGLSMDLWQEEAQVVKGKVVKRHVACAQQQQ